MLLGCWVVWVVVFLEMNSVSDTSSRRDHGADPLTIRTISHGHQVPRPSLPSKDGVSFSEFSIAIEEAAMTPPTRKTVVDE